MASNTKIKAILIAGPTASGKSGFALALARHLGGVVINADSMQVYRELRIITARPTPEEEREAPHALYGFVPAREAYSVGRYVVDAAEAISAARAGGRVPILVGGTGLYFKALLEGLSPIPPIKDDVRAFWRHEAERAGAEALHVQLEARDPATAQRLMRTDKQRIVRALEVLESTGRRLSEWQQVPGVPILDEATTLRFVLAPERHLLMETIDRRFDAMLAAGALEEVRAFAGLGLSEELPCVRAHGVRPLMAHLSGRLSLAEAAEGSKAETRQYAKRQLTWHRRNMIAWKCLSTQEMEQLIATNFADIDMKIDVVGVHH